MIQIETKAFLRPACSTEMVLQRPMHVVSWTSFGFHIGALQSTAGWSSSDVWPGLSVALRQLRHTHRHLHMPRSPKELINPRARQHTAVPTCFSFLSGSSQEGFSHSIPPRSTMEQPEQTKTGWRLVNHFPTPGQLVGLTKPVVKLPDYSCWGEPAHFALENSQVDI